LHIINANPGFGSSLNQKEVKDFLNNSKLNLHFATLDEKGDPNIHPTWFYFDSSTNSIYIGTGRQSKKVNNLKNHDTVYFCIDEANQPYKGVRGKGKVKVHEDIGHNLAIEEKIVMKYHGNLENEGAKMLMSMCRSGDAIIIEIKPSYFSTWDSSSIGH
jgi:general stress protein 26